MRKQSRTFPFSGSVCSFLQEILCTLARYNTVNLAPCTHEEADTRIILRAGRRSPGGSTSQLLHTVDTDVIFAGMLWKQLVVVWDATSTGCHLHEISAHRILNSLGSVIFKSPPVFHAFTGCDTVSCFAGRGKKTAFTVWSSHRAVTDAFLHLATSPTCPVSEACMACLEHLVIVMYDKTNEQSFTQKDRAYDASSSTRAALLQHTCK